MNSVQTRGNSAEYDKTDHFIQNSTTLLMLVQDAAKYAPVPYLQGAAGSVLFIFNTIANTKNNKEDLQRLADDAVALIAAIWRSYEMSERKNEWPSRNLRDVILELVAILDSVVVFVKERLGKRLIVRLVYNVLDTRKIVEYRQRLTSAIQSFQVSSDLNVNQMLVEVLRKQDELLTAAALASNSAAHGQPQAYSVFASNAGHRPHLSSAGLSKPSAVLIGKDTKHNYKPQDTNNALNVNDTLSAPTRYKPPHESSYGGQLQFSNITNSGISIGGGSVSVTNK